MSATNARSSTARDTADGRTAWATGGVLFAGMVLILNGLFQLFEGIAAIAKDNIFLAAPQYTLRLNATSWGWIHLILGALIVIVGYFLLTGALWARMTAMFLVAVQLFTNFFFLPYYPIWALVIIALDVFVLWSLAHAPVREI
jgi:hypothetical protein